MLNQFLLSLNFILTVGTSLLTALKSFKDMIIPTYSSCFSHDSFVDLVDYTRKTIFQHFHLYQFVLTQPQTVDITTVELDVEVPERNLVSLKEGIPKDDWLRIKKKREIEEEYEKKLKELEISEQSAVLQAAANLEEVYQTQLEQFTDRGTKMILPEELSVIVSNLAEAHIEPTQVAMSHGLMKQEIDLTFRLDHLEYRSKQREIDPSSQTTLVRTARSKEPSTSHSRDSANE